MLPVTRINFCSRSYLCFHEYQARNSSYLHFQNQARSISVPLKLPTLLSISRWTPICSKIYIGYNIWDFSPSYLFRYRYQVESHCLHIKLDPSASGISSYYSVFNIKLVAHPTTYTVKSWTRPFIFLFLVLHPPVPSSKHQHSVCGYHISVNPFGTFSDRIFTIIISSISFDNAPTSTPSQCMVCPYNQASLQQSTDCLFLTVHQSYLSCAIQRHTPVQVCIDIKPALAANPISLSSFLCLLECTASRIRRTSSIIGNQSPALRSGIFHPPN